jgi:hypothetical protein
MYRLTVSDSPELAVRILEGIGCQVTRAPNDWIGIHLTSRAKGLRYDRRGSVTLTRLCCLDCKKQTGTLRRCA